MKIKAAIPAEQLPAIIETVKATEFEGHKKYLIEIGLDEAAATTFATAISEIVSAMYNEELSAEEMPEADAAAVSDTPEEARNFAGRVNLAYKEIKAGSTFSGATKAKIAALYESGTTHLKALKALNDEANAVKEESAPEPEKKSAPEPEEVDYDTWVLTQGK